MSTQTPTHTPTNVANAMISLLESAADDIAFGDSERALKAIEGIAADLKTCLHVEVTSYRDPDLTLTLGDVRSAHGIVTELVESGEDGDISMFFGQQDTFETIQGILDNILSRHGVAK
jgi:hypothetical protein